VGVECFVSIVLGGECVVWFFGVGAWGVLWGVGGGGFFFLNDFSWGGGVGVGGGVGALWVIPPRFFGDVWGVFSWGVGLGLLKSLGSVHFVVSRGVKVMLETCSRGEKRGIK